jgi:hypothetical protein
LGQPHGLVDRPRTFTEARLVGVQAFEIAEDGEEIELVRPFFDRLQSL